jgi:hypothetical protein
MPQSWEICPPHHSYGYGVIELFIQLVLHGPTSLRGASGVLSLVASHFFPGATETPCPNCGTNWLLRIGLFELLRPLEQADDWVWLVDHTVQVGPVKCLLIVGCRLSAWRELERPLTHQDLNVIALEPAETSKSEVVKAELEKAMVRTGVPRAILSDGARDLKRAIGDFCLDHPGTANMYDIKHKVALCLKEELEDDPQWKAFFTRAGEVRRTLVHDPLNYLAPPTPRTKGRYMNLGELVAWGVKTRRFLDHPVSPNEQPLNIAKLNLTLQWLRSLDESLAAWQALMQAAEVTLTCLRHSGYHAGVAEELRQELAGLPPLPTVTRFSAAIIQFVTEEAAKARESESLLASTEVIESLIGKGKRLEGQQSGGGFTRMVLGMAAAVATPTKELIEKAFAAVPTKAVAQWAREKLGPSMQSCRRAALGALPAGTNST